jgi:hypothetical protein
MSLSKRPWFGIQILLTQSDRGAASSAGAAVADAVSLRGPYGWRSPFQPERRHAG